MKLFKLEDYKCEVNSDEVFMIPEFRVLFELKYNKGKGDHDGRLRKRAYKELTYMFFMFDFTSEYRQYSEEERHVEALSSAELPENYNISQELKLACDKFKVLQETRILKLLKAAYIAIDKIRTYLEDIKFEEVNNAGNLKNEPNKVIIMLNNLSKTVESLEKLEEKVKSSFDIDTKNRGDKEEGRIR